MIRDFRKYRKMFALMGVALAAILNLGCAQTEKEDAATALPASVESWLGDWKGVQPERAMRNSNGEALVIRGKEATVKSSDFFFAILKGGKATMRQEFEDGRTMNFSGTWKGQLTDTSQSTSVSERESTSLAAIVFDLAADDTGAYRQYVLLADREANQVICAGKASEPRFVVQQ